MSEHIYANMTMEERDNVFSQFLIDSWSYSKVMSFARNEKAFEMQYIYGVYSKSSATTNAGNAYHHALQYYFTQKQQGVEIDIVEAERSAFEYIDNIPANNWKIQKTTPTVEECVKKAYTNVSTGLRNFFSEKDLYENEIDEILQIEVYGDQFLTINGVDIPLPCHFKIDLVANLKNGNIAVMDHKLRTSFTPDDEMALSIGCQAITYVNGYETLTGIDVNEVWFIENKVSANKDKSPQLSVYRVNIDINTRRLYEALLYEPLKRMIQAVNDPDYTFLINQSDNFVDKAELYDFWCRTMICEVEDFNVSESKKAMISQRLKKIKDSSVDMVSPAVIKKFKETASQFIQYDMSNKDMTAEQKIEHVLRSFGTMVRVAHKFEGYSSNTFLLEVSAGVKITSIYSHRLDIANALDVNNVRISKEMVVYEGKSYLAIDFVKTREKDLLFDSQYIQGMKIPLGRDNFGNLISWDLDNHSTPHMLICGATGSGKSVLVKTILESGMKAGIPNIIIMDPKFEFTNYNFVNNTIVVNDILEIEEQMARLVEYMNDQIAKGKKEKTLIIFDEFADAVANSRKGNELKLYEMKFEGVYAKGSEKKKRECVGELKSLEENLKIILQKGRSCGIRVVAATQRASVKVITGDAKVNFPVQVCFRVPKEQDSRVVLDEPGAESLAGYGDGLIKSPAYNDTIRFQAFYKPETQPA